MTPMYTNALFSELNGAEGGKSRIYINSACIGQTMNAILSTKVSIRAPSRTSHTPKQPLHTVSVHDDPPAGNKTHEPEDGQDEDRKKEELGVV
jgi:hypothetical protein